MLDGVRKHVSRPFEIIADIQQPVDLRAALGPLFDLVKSCDRRRGEDCLFPRQTNRYSRATKSFVSGRRDRRNPTPGGAVPRGAPRLGDALLSSPRAETALYAAFF
jgi:hypothetical protein